MTKNPLTLPCIMLSAACALSLTCAAALAIERYRSEPVSALPKDALTEETNGDDPEQGALPDDPEPEEPSEQTAPPEIHFVPADFPDAVYIYDNGTDSVEYPLIEGARLSDWDMAYLENNAETKRRALYDENGKKRTRFGIDVSSHQGLIDWERVAADGVEFAFLRIGYRGYETGKIVEDPRFRLNLEGAQAAGIDVGVYFFSQAISAVEGEEEADFVLNVLSECVAELELPIVFDWEHPTDDDPARTDELSGEEQTAACLAFCAKVLGEGYKPCYYTTVNMALFRYDIEVLGGIPMWLAEYCDKTAFPYAYDIWQYSASGVVDGIETLTDLNIMIIE